MILAVGRLTKHGATYTYVPEFGVVLEVSKTYPNGAGNQPSQAWRVTVLNDLTGKYSDHGVKYYPTLKKVKEQYV